jgi:hypothetical protein
MAFMQSVADLSPQQRETAAWREISRGNFPDFLRQFCRVPIHGRTASGQTLTAHLEVMCDYLAVGGNDDFVRIPLRPQTAQKLADQFGCMLPTRKMVDAIDRHAQVHLRPKPMTKDRQSVATFIEHHQIIEKQRAGRPLGLLVTGIKKDVVVSPRLLERPHRVAIYGWRKLDGRPIQNLTTVHVDRYVDYSHGIRLIRDTVRLDGQRVRVAELLRDENRCDLLSDEGPLAIARYPTTD